MPVDRQLAIIATLRTKLGTEDDASARTLLSELRRRPDVAYATAVEIDHMLGVTSGPPSGPRPRDEQQDEGRGRRLAMAAAAAGAVLVIAVGTSWAVTHWGGDEGRDSGDPGAGPAQGESMSESSGSNSESGSMTASPAPATQALDLMTILAQADANSGESHLLPPQSCAPVSDQEVKCTAPYPSVISVDFKRYGSTAALYDAYMAKAQDVSGAPFQANQHDCNKQYSSGEVSWNHNQRHSRRYTVDQLVQDQLDEDTQAAGRVFCDTNDNVQTLVWTQNPNLLAVVVGHPPDPVKSWWRVVHHDIACLGADGADICGDMAGMDGPSDGASTVEPSEGMTDGMG
jgi:hypothetical protein